MDTTAVSKLKATCLERLERVRQIGRPLQGTKRGAPVAQILPPPALGAPLSGFGIMAGTVTAIGEILAPLEESDWEVLRCQADCLPTGSDQV